MIRVGEWDTQTESEPLSHSDHDVKEIIIHKDFIKANVNNDIALMILEDSVLIADHVSSVCLPLQDTSYSDQGCYVTGWGKGEFGREGREEVKLRKINLPIVPFNTCQESLRKSKLGHRFVLHESFLCAGGEAGKGD